MSAVGASIWVAMSASIHWRRWKWMTLWPNCWRWWTYLSVSSSAPSAIPSAWAPTPGREMSKVFIATMNPMPSRPIFGVRERDRGVDLGLAAVRDEHLGAVEHVLVALAARGGADGAGVGA